MGGMSSFAMPLVSLGTTLAGHRTTQRSIQRGVHETFEDTARDQRATLLERDHRRSVRHDDLRARLASARAGAAAGGVSGGASARAIQERLIARSDRDQGFDDARTDIEFERHGLRRRRSLLDAAEQRQRANLGIVRQLTQIF